MSGFTGNAGNCLSTEAERTSSVLLRKANASMATFFRLEPHRKIYYPSQEKEDEKDMDRKMILKYQKLARLATHTNDWLRKIAAADLEKSLYENRITTGTAIDGKCIRLSTIEKYCGSWNMQRFRQAMKNKKKFSTLRFDFCGYDGTLWCEPRDNGDMAAGFSKEYRNCGNGYYYLLINDEFMIGYDID